MRIVTFIAALAIGLLPGLAAGLTLRAPQQSSAPLPTTAPPPGTSAMITDFDLPKLGLAGGAAFPKWKAEAIGRNVYYELEHEGGVLNDPLVASYVNYLGHRLSSVAEGPDMPFHYFVVRDSEINAFALPGAYVGVNTGLITVTRNEDELAGVMAHETAHVVQRHIARKVASSKYNSLLNIGILLGAIAVAAANPDLAAGALMGASGGVAQREINYTRADEMEADRVGIAILGRAHFNPQGMVNFFEYMQREYAMQGYHIPEFLSTHPLDLTRITEAEMRAKEMHVTVAPEDPSYALMRARIRVLTSDNVAATLDYFRGEERSESKPWYREAAVYGMVLCLNQLYDGKQALALIKPLARAHPDNVALQLAWAESLLAAGQTAAGLNKLAQDAALYPESVAVTDDYAQALFNAGKPEETVKVLTPLLANPDNVFDPDLYQLLATAAERSGHGGLALLSMANYFGLRGQYYAALVQLRLALQRKHLSPVRRAQIERRKKALEKELKQAKQLGMVGDNGFDSPPGTP